MSEKDPKLAKPPTNEELEERLRQAVDQADAGNLQPRPEKSRSPQPDENQD